MKNGIFKKNITCKKSLALAQLWWEKASKSNGVPLRKDFTFEEFVKFGQNIFLGKLDEDKRWKTTFCGNNIADQLGFDPTGKTLNEIASPNTLKFWLENLQILTSEHRIYLKFYTLEYEGEEYTYCSELNLPLRSEAGGEPDTVLTHDTYSDEALYPDHLK